MKKKILLISYDFPPIGGGGVQRNVKFLKYLSRLGWKTNVLTVKDRDYYVFDDSLLKEVKETKIYKSNSFDPNSIVFKIKTFFRRGKTQIIKKKSKVNESGIVVLVYRFIRKWILLPDGVGGWIPFAYKKGCEIIDKNKPDILYCTFPVSSNAFVTYLLWRKYKIPYVIDFRDAWVDDPYSTFATILHKKFHMYFERKILLNAKKIIVYGQSLKDVLDNKYPKLNSEIEIITNGFDPEDFEMLIPKKGKNNKKRIIYSGSVWMNRKIPFLNFLKAIKMLDKDMQSKLEVIFVGVNVGWAIDLIEEMKLEHLVTFTGYLNHKHSLEFLKGGDASLLFLKPNDYIAITGKVFEYIAIGNPIIACVEERGACADLLRSIEHDQGICNPSDPKMIKNIILKVLGNQIKFIETNKISNFSRKIHSSRLDKILTKLT